MAIKTVSKPIRRGCPRSLAGQLFLGFATLILLVEGMGLVTLMWERRAVGRESRLENAITDMGEQAASLVLEDLDLPQVVRAGGRGDTHVSAGGRNRAERVENGTRLPRSERALSRALVRAGWEPLAVTVVRAPVEASRLPPLRGRPPSRDRPGGEGRGPRRPPRGGPPPPFGGDDGPPASVQVEEEGEREMEQLLLSAQLAPDVWLNGAVEYRVPRTFDPRTLLATLITLFGAAGVAAWFASRISAPLGALTRSAEALGRGTNATPIAPDGPVEVRQAASAFNRMNERLTRVLETQRMMLRAVGHDLRTPLTALRLKLENLAPGSERDSIEKSLDEIQQMTDEILTWARDATGNEALAEVDLGALVQSVVDDYMDVGQPVVAEELPSTIVPCRRAALRRALRNLIDNAISYGERAQVSLTIDGHGVSIDVRDDGPGIPAEDVERVMAPFVRLEHSRSRSTGGTGLGLAIARSVIENHGGELLLRNATEGGLVASMWLPR
ncbi:MAG: ATP-binding protein [Pseudomonadota bacterium]